VAGCAARREASDGHGPVAVEGWRGEASTRAARWPSCPASSGRRGRAALGAVHIVFRGAESSVLGGAYRGSAGRAAAWCIGGVAGGAHAAYRKQGAEAETQH
jgi:hypothetical protein